MSTPAYTPAVSPVGTWAVTSQIAANAGTHGRPPAEAWAAKAGDLELEPAQAFDALVHYCVAKGAMGERTGYDVLASKGGRRWNKGSPEEAAIRRRWNKRRR